MGHESSQSGNNDAIVGEKKYLYMSLKFYHGCKVTAFFRYDNEKSEKTLAIIQKMSIFAAKKSKKHLDYENSKTICFVIGVGSRCGLRHHFDSPPFGTSAATDGD